ncbi:MAG TPA: DUF4105 domain-containing protein [Gemmatimonadaceae bacterium]|nr:DUF4105 domain-containing protein [Gemmatimonadaceae bacterium]
MRRVRAVALALFLGAGPLAAQEVVPADSSGIPGNELSVYLLTMGQGDLVWERFGHNAIGIRDRVAGTDVVYNWGIFSFSQPGFVGRFLRGDMLYWMAPGDAAQTIAEYVALDRSVVIQELNLSPAQRIALRDFVVWNAREENRYYRYDYFLDNCSTRVRDALDRVLGGAIRGATQQQETGTSFRWHALRLMAEDVLTSVGIDIGLGRPSDRPISAWEEMFIPMRLRDHIRSVQVPDERGRLVPLVTSERVVFEARRAPERARPPNRLPALFGLGLLLAAGLWWLWRRGQAGHAAARRTAFSAAVVWSTLVGVLGLVLVLLRVATAHQAAYDNSNAFLYNPLWLVLPVLALTAVISPRAGRLSGALARTLQVLSGLGVVLLLVPAFRQDSLAVMLLALPLNLVAAELLRGPARPPVLLGD